MASDCGSDDTFATRGGPRVAASGPRAAAGPGVASGNPEAASPSAAAGAAGTLVRGKSANASAAPKKIGRPCKKAKAESARGNLSRAEEVEAPYSCA